MTFSAAATHNEIALVLTGAQVLILMEVEKVEAAGTRLRPLKRLHELGLIERTYNDLVCPYRRTVRGEEVLREISEGRR